MKVYEIRDDWGIEHVLPGMREAPEPAPEQVLVRMQAASLNYRDLLTVLGLAGKYPLPLIPVSDGTGRVEAIGSRVDLVKPGDRVCPRFYQSWLTGPPSEEHRSQILAGSREGVLQEYLVLDQDGVSKVPDHLSALEAATLPCAALTAWRAVAVEGGVGQGDTVLLQGTGGVSLFALQFARLFGARIILTSSDDRKLERARALGADHLINYEKRPEWGADVLDITNGEGVDLVVEVGGAATLEQSIRATRTGGRIVLIGVLSGQKTELLLSSLFLRQLRLSGISVGNREHFEAMCQAISAAELHPVIDAVYPFSGIRDALRHMKSATHFGKICIDYGAR